MMKRFLEQADLRQGLCKMGLAGEVAWSQRLGGGRWDYFGRAGGVVKVRKSRVLRGIEGYR